VVYDAGMSALTFRPTKLETVVVMRGNDVVGTIRRYHGKWQTRVPGVLTPASNPGQTVYDNLAAAKAALLAADA